jgi:hypothetical protein
MIGWEPARPLFGDRPAFFGRRMEPVTLGHLVLLAEMGINYTAGESLEDISRTVFVCSRAHAVSRRAVCRPWFGFRLRCWGEYCGEHLNLAEESNRFIDWFAGQLKGPITKSKAGDMEQDGGAPLHANLMACCLGMLGLSMRETLNLPVKEARQLICAYGEARGEMKLWTVGDERRRERSVELGLVEPRRN